ncbi:hypothetical protein LTR08_001208 [Meristemomyces frigidus]|nr:hypothetical protein LTR08_001208 [Meristemomyces frigidus]
MGGFDRIVEETPESTLLGLMNRLDKQLESILSGKMADTIKLVANNRSVSKPVILAEKPRAFSPLNEQAPVNVQVPFTMQQKTDAKATRQAHTRQLEARFSRLPSFFKSPDGLSYVMPLDSPKKAFWPAELQSLRSFRLDVPEIYPLEAANAHLDSGCLAARNVERVFRTLQAPTLTQLVNYLAQHITEMAVKPVTEQPQSAPAVLEKMKQILDEETNGAALPAIPNHDNDRPHLQIIPRPPEWQLGIVSADLSGDESESDSDESTSDDDSETDVGEDVHPTGEGTTVAAVAERGVLLSFPQLELYGIELLELVSLNITIKCERCKDIMDVQKLRNSAIRQETCKKCALPLAVGFRAELVHVNSFRAGYLDLDGCTVIDMLLRQALFVLSNFFSATDQRLPVTSYQPALNAQPRTQHLA